MDEEQPTPAVVLAAAVCATLLLVVQTRALGAAFYVVAAPFALALGYALPALIGEVVLGLALVALGTRAVGGRYGRRPGAVTAAVLLVVAAWCVNFSVVAPRAYYELHRWEFARAGSAEPDRRLLPHLAHLSLDGKAADAASDPAAEGAILLTSWAGLHDDAGGYVHVDRMPPPRTVLDLGGRPVWLERCTHLDGGWWWC